MMKLLQENQLKVEDIREQGYDRAADMSGPYQGLQSRIQTASTQCLSSPIFQAQVCCLLIINSPTTRPESQRFAELEPRCPALSISLKGLNVIGLEETGEGLRRD
eukprot:superscaffoldBa00001323_g10061